MQQSRKELQALLAEQMEFIDASCDAFDAGRKAESKRLALSVRVLLWETKKSHSLVGQLTELSTFSLLDMLVEPPSEDGAKMLAKISLTMAMGENGFEYRAGVPLTPGLPRTHLADWWAGRIMFNERESVSLTRRNVVDELSHKDGGAHVDPVLPSSYRELSRMNAFKLEVVNTADDGTQSVPDPVLLNPYPASMRQIAEEVRQTIRQSPELFQP